MSHIRIGTLRRYRDLITRILYSIRPSPWLIPWAALAVSGCSVIDYGSHSFALDASGEDRWSQSVHPSKGEISTTIPMEPGSQARLALLDRYHHSPVLYLRISDVDCETGHTASIGWYAGDNESRNAYFDKEVPWGAPVTAVLAWDGEGRFQVRFNDEVIKGRINSRPSKLLVTAEEGVVVVEQLAHRKNTVQP